MTSWSKPTPQQIELAVANLKGNLREQFFSKLRNPEWFDCLNQSSLLSYNINTDDSGTEYREWSALQYLSNIAKEIPDKVMTLIQPILTEMNEQENVNLWLVQNCLFLSIHMPDKYFVQIINQYNRFVKKSKNIGWQDLEQLKIIFRRAKEIDETLAIDLSKNILSVTLEEECEGEWHHFTPHIKLPNTGYDYQETLKIIQNIFSEDSIKLLTIFITIISQDLIKLLSTENIQSYYSSFNIKRTAIEDHSQDKYKKDDPIYILVSAIRDLSLSILRNNQLNEINSMLDILEKSNSPICIRIILHLLRVSNNIPPHVLYKYITDPQIFDNLQYRYEYFHLIQDRFPQLPSDVQDKIFDLINKGANEISEKEKSNNSLTEKECWLLEKLTPIRYSLPQHIENKYKHILYDEFGNERILKKHPDLVFWSETKWGYTSPLEEEQLEKKSIDEIIEYLNSWKPNESYDINAPEVRGLAESIRIDSIKNPDKYLNGLEKFKEIQDPTYIHYLLSGIQESKNITEEQWKNIIIFGEWISKQNNIFENKNRYRDGDSNWYNAKTSLIELFMKAFKDEKKLTNIEENIVSKVYQILKDFSLARDPYLDKHHDKGDADHLTIAINTLHGRSIDAIIKYARWLKNNNKPLKDVENVLDKLFNNNLYLETYAMLSCMLPLLHYMLPQLVERNINKLMPEDVEKREVFDVSWKTYLNYSNIFNEMFPLLQNKFIFVLQNNLYSNEDSNEERRISQHLVTYYARNVFELDSCILSLLFDNPNNNQEQQEFIKFIGFSLWNNDGNQDIDINIIQRFQNFWEWFIKRIEGKEQNYINVLSQFERWYQCKKFDKDWVLEQLYNLVVNKGIPMHLFMLEEQLLKDLPLYTRKVFDIVKTLFFSRQEHPFYSRTDLIENIIKYIYENNFPQDPSLKSDKDIFINDYLENCEAWKIDNELKKFSKYLEKRHTV